MNGYVIRDDYEARSFDGFRSKSRTDAGDIQRYGRYFDLFSSRRRPTSGRGRQNTNTISAECLSAFKNKV